MHKNFRNILLEFTRQVNEGRESFIQSVQSVLKVCKTFKVKSLETPKLNVSLKKTTYNIFYIYM